MREGHDKRKMGEAMKKNQQRRSSLGSLPGSEQRSEVYHQVFNTALNRNVIPIRDGFRLLHTYLSLHTVLDNNVLQRH